MKIVMLLFACMASTDFTSAMRRGFLQGSSSGSTSRSVDNYDIPQGSTIYIRVTDEITLFGSLRVFELYADHRPYGDAFVYGDAMRRVRDREERVKYYAVLDAYDEDHGSENRVHIMTELQHSFSVYIERPNLPPLKSTLISQQLSGKRKVTFRKPGWCRADLMVRGALEQIAENECFWMPSQACRDAHAQRHTEGRTTAEMHFQPGVHILMRKSEPGFRFENDVFCRGYGDNLEITEPTEDDVVTESGFPIVKFKAGAWHRWIPRC